MNIQILNNDLSLFGIAAGFESVEFVRAFNGKGSFTLKINANNANAKYIKIDKIVYLDEKRIGYIDKVTTDRKGSKAAEYITAQGVELKDRLSRLIYPDDGLVNDSYTDEYLETVVKSLINKNAGYLAAQNRQIPNLVTAADTQRGGRVDYSARYKDLSTEIYSLLASREMGLCCTIDFDSGNIVFDVAEGRDLTAAIGEAGGIALSLDTKTALELLDTDDRLSYKNLSVTAGLGDGAEREILEVGTELSGYARREVFTDARDIETNDELTTRGLQKLSQIAKTRGVAVRANNAGAYKAGEDYELGDYISVDANGELYHAQIVKLRDTYDKRGYAETEVVLNFDMEDTLAYDIAAKHIDYDALVSKDTAGSVVADITLDAAASAISISGIDMKADGDLYGIYMLAMGGGVGTIDMYANSAPTGNVYSMRRQVVDSLSAAGPLSALASYYFEDSRIGKLRQGIYTIVTGQIARADNVLRGSFVCGIIESGVQILVDYTTADTRSQTNVTSLTFTGDFAAGTRMRVVRMKK